MKRQTIVPATLALLVTIIAVVATAFAQKANEAPGVTANAIRVGQTMPYSGPASIVGTLGKAHTAYFKMINEQGGVNGRQINLVSLDDGFNPARTLANVRELVENEHVAFLFGSAGTPTNLATVPYITAQRIPLLFPVSGTRAFYQPKQHPWIVGWFPTYHLDGLMNAQYILAHVPGAKVGVLYENDDFGRELLRGLRDGLGDRSATMIVHAASYEVSDPTVESQVIELQQSGANVFYIGGSPKFSAQAISSAAAVGWKPVRLLNYSAQSIPGTLALAGLKTSVGIISHAFAKDPRDPQWQGDPELKVLYAWERKYLPEANPDDGNAITAYAQAATLVQVLKQCGDDLTRANIVRHATNLDALRLPLMLAPFTTTPTDYQGFKELKPVRFDGTRWALLPPAG
jgi:branched-chain amino acid transport system substrate-binding protein